jgi:hypothetical protein
VTPGCEAPNVAHVVPEPGNPIVPVEEVASGLTPADGISVAPSGIPVPPKDELESIPSGEVGPIGTVDMSLTSGT